MDFSDIAQQACTQNFNSASHTVLCTAVVAHLRNYTAILCHIPEVTSLPDSAYKRFLNVDMTATLHGLDCGTRMGMIRCSHYYCIQSLIYSTYYIRKITMKFSYISTGI
jgi:hypothetical protein